MKVYLTIEDKIINMPPEDLPEYYRQNKWDVIYSNELDMWVTAPPSAPPPMASVE